MNKIKDWVPWVIIAGVLLLWLLLPPTRSGDITPYQEREVLMRHELERKVEEIKTLKGSEKVWAQAYAQLGDTVELLAKKVSAKTPIYIEYRQATDERPDSANFAREAIAAREVIDTQEEHINALLGLKTIADSLLITRQQIIQSQEEALLTWPERYNNMVAQKNEEIKHERKRGNGKFLKGMGVGAAVIVVVLVLI